MNKEKALEIMKSEGLEVAEDMAVVATKAAIKLMREILPQVSRGFGLAFNLFLDAYEARLFDVIDKIDGKDDPNY